MTTIAWDGQTLAGDRQLNVGDLKLTCCKVFRLKNGGLFGGAGPYEEVLSIREWLDGGDRPNDLSEVECIYVHRSRCASLIERRLVMMPILEHQHAIGSGAHYAIAAMACGKDASAAIEISTRFDPATGHGVDAIRLRERR